LQGILGQAKNTLAAADETLGLATRLRIPRLSALVWMDRVIDLVHANHLDRIAQEVERAFELQRAAGAKWELAHTQMIALFGWFGTGRLDQIADDRLDGFERLAQQVGYYGQLGFIQLIKAARRFTQGDFRVSIPLRHAIDFFEKQGAGMSMEPMAMLGLLELWQGREVESVQTFEHLPTGKVIPVWEGWAASHQLLAMAYGGARDTRAFLDNHRSWLPIAGEPNRGGSWLLLPAMVEALAMLGDCRRAFELYPLLPELLETGTVITYGAGLGLVEKTAGIAAAAGGRWSDAEVHFERARQQADEIPHRIDQADVPRWWAWMLLERDGPGDRDQARELLGHARGIYDEIGTPIHVKIANELMEHS
jgi:hypothetical protein